MIGNVVEHRSPAFLRRRDTLRQPRRRPSASEQEQRQRREEARRRSLKLGDQLELQRRRLETVLRVRMHRTERLRFEREIAAVVHEHRLERRRISSRRRPPNERDARRRRVVREPDARWKRDLDADRRVLGDPRRAEDAVVETVAHEQRIAGVCRQTLLGVLGRERARPDTVTRDAGPAVALERLLVEETPALFEAPRQAREPGRAVKLVGIAVEGDGARRPRRARLRFGVQDQLAHKDRRHDDDGESGLECHE